MNDYLSFAIEKTKELFEKSGVDAGHGIDHSLIVMNHASNALKQFAHLSELEKNSVLLAALLHDVDDGKFFDHLGYENAEKILQQYPLESALTLKMISLVSCSKNGNTQYNGPIWILIPRWADRLEAMGKIGIERCEIYNSHIGRPKYLPNTERVKNINELEQVATLERFEKYQNGKSSESMIDHFYDKLLHLRICTSISYIDELMEEKHQEMVQYVLKFWEENIEK
jgi:uncharacterized protein